MARTDFTEMACSVAKTIGTVGEQWSLLIMRDAFLGVRRFEDFQRDLGIARNILSDRLNRLVAEEVLERRRYSSRPERFEYRLTPKGHDLYPVLLFLQQWGDRWIAGGEGPPRRLIHDECGKETTAVAACIHCGGAVTARSVKAEPLPDVLTGGT
jgi:DNA-binding HxlR family transcriptional regulator